MYNTNYEELLDKLHELEEQLESTKGAISSLLDEKDELEEEIKGLQERLNELQHREDLNKHLEYWSQQ